MRLLIIFILIPFIADAQIIKAEPFYRPLAKNLILDDYPNPAGAYSLRKLRTAYTGNCIKVRRKSDNTEQDIGFVGENLDTTSLKNFVGTSATDSGWVTTWYDQQGSRNATQSVAASQPRIVTSGVISVENTRPTMFFDGTNDFFRVDSIVNTGQIYFFSVFKPNTTSGQRSIYGQINASGSTIGQIFVFVGRTTARMGITWVNGYLTSSNADFGTNLQLFNHYKTGSASNWIYGYYRNGNDEGSFTSISNASATAQPAAIGRGGAFNSFYLSGELSEIIYYNSNESSNRTGIQTNINTYYSAW